jgi:hypothetical protein
LKISESDNSGIISLTHSIEAGQTIEGAVSESKANLKTDYPIVSTGHMAGSFEEEMRTQGIAENLPIINEPTNQRFTLNLLKETTSLEIDVSGQGYNDWLAKKKEHEAHPGTVIESVCLPNVKDCSVYGPAGEGTQGTGGQPGAFPDPTTVSPAPPGYCYRVGTQNGAGGVDF